MGIRGWLFRRFSPDRRMLYRMAEREINTKDERGRAGRSGVEIAQRGGTKKYAPSKVSVTLATEQDLYQDEVIVQALNVDVAGMEEGARASDTHGRVQIYLGPADAETAQMLEFVAQRIRKMKAADATVD